MEAMGFNNAIIETRTETTRYQCGPDIYCNQTREITTKIDVVTPGLLTTWNGIKSNGVDTGSTSRMSGGAYPPISQIPMPVTSGADLAMYIYFPWPLQLD